MNNKIFLVERDSSIVSTLTYPLESRGYDLIGCSNGREAIEGILISEPDLVLLDTSLPDIDGYTVCNFLRQRGFKNPIIFLSEDTENINLTFQLKGGRSRFH